MHVGELLSTPERQRILRRILYSPTGASLRKLASEADVSPSQVHKYFSILKKGNLMTRAAKLKDSALLRTLRLLENLAFLADAKVAGAVLSSLSGVEGIGLYGSWSKGTNDEKADIDFWVLVGREPKDLELGKLRRELQEKTGKTIDLTVLTFKKFGDLKVRNPTFYYALLNSLTLWGNDLWSV